MQITQTGRQLATEIDTSFRGECSLIRRHAVTYQRIQEMACECHPAMNNPNIDISIAHRLQARREVWLEKREEQLEKRITVLVSIIPEIDSVSFQGDPRGMCVKLHLKSGKYNSWGGADDGWRVTV